jgi:hypothetical protein
MARFLRDRTMLASVLLVASALGYAACGGEADPMTLTGCANVGDCDIAGFPAGTQCLGGYCIPPGVDAGPLADAGPGTDASTDDASVDADAAVESDAGEMDAGSDTDGGIAEDAGDITDGGFPDDAPTSGAS